MSQPSPDEPRPLVRCESCGARHAGDALSASLWTCPSCGFHLPMPARARLEFIADPGTLGPVVDETTGGDPLSFADSEPYPERLGRARKATGQTEAFIAQACTLGGVPSVIGAFDFAFMGGTMSAAAGERIAGAFERATDERRALVLFTSTGGARMQEGTLSLFQMAKATVARHRHAQAGLPYVCVLCHPTLGGVAASFGTQADVCLAEPRARIGFAGPRVIAELVGRALPEGFQRAEFVQEHGFVDRIVERANLRPELVRLVGLLSGRPSSPRG